LVLPALAAEPGFTDLFDGKTLNGWTRVGDRGSGYFVEKGLLVAAPDFHGNLFTDAEYGNFVLRFDFRLTEGANNGIGIRAPLLGDTAYSAWRSRYWITTPTFTKEAEAGAVSRFRLRSVSRQDRLP